MESKRLRELPIEYLWDGLVLKDDIFNHTGTVLLIPKGETITTQKIQRLLNFDIHDKHIMVCEDTYFEIISDAHIPPEKRQELTENYVGYSHLQQNVGGLFHRPDYESWLHNEELEPIIQEISEKVTDIDPVTIFSCINFPRPMDEGLQRHSLNVAFMNGMIGKWLELSPEEVKTLVLAGLLHDIGKTRIPEEILNAPRKLTPEEFAIMRNHPVYSDELLGERFGEEVRLAARHHHEKLSGNGYPDGIAGDEISLYARITTVSDIYDAMVARRSYKEARLPFYVFDLFYSGEFEGLDRDLVMLFLKKMRHNYMDKQVVMSDGEKGIIRYIPPNDSDHPIVQQGEKIQQTDETWYCTEIITAV